MLHVKTILKFSPIHGVGCFTTEDIKKGQIVWQFDPRFDIEIEESLLPTLNPAVQDFFAMYSYGQMNGNKKTLVLCGDHARHMNHSDDPNLSEESSNPGINFAIRDIKAGEELTCDYLLFDLNVKQKLKV